MVRRHVIASQTSAKQAPTLESAVHTVSLPVPNLRHSTLPACSADIERRGLQHDARSGYLLWGNICWRSSLRPDLLASRPCASPEKSPTEQKPKPGQSSCLSKLNNVYQLKEADIQGSLASNATSYALQAAEAAAPCHGGTPCGETNRFRGEATH